jgi:hypothetical protein
MQDASIIIRSGVSLMSGGVMTTSSLTMLGVTGFDSDVVECFSEYSVSGGAVISSVRSEATLSVLGKRIVASRPLTHETVYL